MKTLVLVCCLLRVGGLFAQTERITFQAPMLYPEGTCAYNNAFYISSAKKATIGKVSLNGEYTVFYDEPALKSTFGMKVDSANHILWVCAGDPNYSQYADSATYKKMIRLVGIDLENAWFGI